MRDPGVDTGRNRTIVIILLIVAIIAQTALITYRFVINKENYYADEYFTYGLSNSATQPFLYGSKLYTFDNYDVFLSGDDLKYYLRTSDETSFNYPVSWNNQVSDTLPPLYQMLIHTVSSFNPNEFSWNWGLYINLFAFVISQIVLFCWILSNTGSDKLSLLLCVFWGFTIGCQNATMMVRMYMLYMLFSLLLVYLSDRFISSGITGSNGSSHYVLLIITTCLGALTHHLFLVFAFFYTLIRCVICLWAKRYKLMFRYGLTILGGVILSFIVFPATFSHLFGSNQVEWGEEPDLFMGLYSLNRLLFGEVSGIFLNVYPSVITIILCVVVFVLIALCTAYFWLHRKDAMEGSRLNRLYNAVKHVAGNGHGSAVIVLVTIAVYFIFMASQFNYYVCFENSDKYVFSVMPLFIGGTGVISYGLLNCVKKTRIKKIMYCAVCLLIVLSVSIQNLTPVSEHLIYCETDHDTNGRIRDHVDDNSDVLLLLDSSVYIPCFCEELADIDKTYVTLFTDEHYAEVAEDIDVLFDDPGDKYILFLCSDREIAEKACRFVEQRYGVSAEMVTQQSINYMLATLYKAE